VVGALDQNLPPPAGRQPLLLRVDEHQRLRRRLAQLRDRDPGGGRMHCVRHQDPHGGCRRCGLGADLRLQRRMAGQQRLSGVAVRLEGPSEAGQLQRGHALLVLGLYSFFVTIDEPPRGTRRLGAGLPIDKWPWVLQGGSMLVEVMVSLALAIAGPVSPGRCLLRQGRLTQQRLVQPGLANVYFPRDVANSKAGASSTASDGSPRPSGALVDCIGGEGAGGDVRVALITPSHRRIVYSVTGGGGSEGLSLWRRECPNRSRVTDATLSDPALSAPAGLNPGYIDPATSGNNGSSVRRGSRQSTCPPRGQGDAACW
jgi:hypothetical protein